MSASIFLHLIQKAILAPSVHNVQPARWRINGDGIILVEDTARRLLVGDPGGNDSGISLGAAVEGLSLAASEDGQKIVEDHARPLPDLSAPLRAIKRFVLEPGVESDRLASFVETRASWRGGFVAHTQADRDKLHALTDHDVTVVSDPTALAGVAKQYDGASFGFMRQSAFRRELRSWMRLSKHHPDWSRDGLNSDAMVLSAVEAGAASIVLGGAFEALDKVGVARLLLAEGQKIRQAAGVVLFHRPADEAPFESGRHFYRLWLSLEAAGFGAAVLAALADDVDVAKALCSAYGIDPNRRLVSAFRVGRLGDKRPSPRARLRLEDVLV
jgi:hypothetical protein